MAPNKTFLVIILLISGISSPNFLFSSSNKHTDSLLKASKLSICKAIEYDLNILFSDSSLFGKIQWIHGSADYDIDIVDIYLNGEKIISNLAFGESTALMDIPLGMNRVAVSPSFLETPDTAWSGQDLFIDTESIDSTNQENGDSFLAILNGVRDTSIHSWGGYNTSFKISTFRSRCNAKDLSPFDTELLFFQYIIGSSPINIFLEGDSIPLISNLSPGIFPSGYISLPSGNKYNLHHLDSLSLNENTYAIYNLDFTETDKRVFTLLIAGMYGFTTSSPSGPSFEMYIIDCEGNVIRSHNTIFDVSTRRLEELGIQYYPNPVKNNLFLETPKFLDNLEIISMEGKVIRSMKNLLGSTNISLVEIPSGLYFIRVYAEQKLFWGKLIKQ